MSISGYETGDVMLSSDEIQARVRELGKQITDDYAKEPLLVIGILKGAFVFLADLVRAIDLDLEVDFMSVSSYGSGTQSEGHVVLKRAPDADPAGRHVLLVEDIIDSGTTMEYLKNTYFADKQAKSVKICTLLDKPARRTTDIEADYTGFSIDDKFIVGYGLDYGEHLRQLPHITYLKESQE